MVTEYVADDSEKVDDQERLKDTNCVNSENPDARSYRTIENYIICDKLQKGPIFIEYIQLTEPICGMLDKETGAPAAIYAIEDGKFALPFVYEDMYMLGELEPKGEGPTSRLKVRVTMILDVTITITEDANSREPGVYVYSSQAGYRLGDHPMGKYEAFIRPLLNSARVAAWAASVINEAPALARHKQAWLVWKDSKKRRLSRQEEKDAFVPLSEVVKHGGDMVPWDDNDEVFCLQARLSRELFRDQMGLTLELDISSKADLMKGSSKGSSSTSKGGNTRRSINAEEESGQDIDTDEDLEEEEEVVRKTGGAATKMARRDSDSDEPVTALVASGAKGKVVKEAPKSGRRTTLNKSKTKNKQGGKQKDPLKAKIDQYKDKGVPPDEMDTFFGEVTKKTMSEDYRRDVVFGLLVGLEHTKEKLIELGCFDHMMEWLTDHVDKVLDTSESMLRRNHTADEYLDYTSNLFNLLSLVCPTETKWGEETYYGHIMHKTNDAIIHICENGSPSPTMKRNAGVTKGHIVQLISKHGLKRGRDTGGEKRRPINKRIKDKLQVKQQGLEGNSTLTQQKSFSSVDGGGGGSLSRGVSFADNLNKTHVLPPVVDQASVVLPDESNLRTDSMSDVTNCPIS